MVLGDFNAETSNPTISEFCATYSLKNLIKVARVVKFKLVFTD